MQTLATISGVGGSRDVEWLHGRCVVVVTQDVGLV